jgi:hypothetical protein
LAGAFVAVVVVLGAASPAIAATGMYRILRSHSDGFVYSRPDLARDGFVRRAASHLGPRVVVEAQGSDEIAFLLFEFSGTKLATYDDPRLIGNELRIRYADLAARWNKQMFGQGFAPDYIVRPATGANLVIERGEFDGREWEMVAVDG